MEEDPVSLTEKRRTLRSVRWLILFIALATAVGWFLMPPATEPRTLFLHPDGQLSLGRRDGEKFPPSAIEGLPSDSDAPPVSDHFVLDSPPGTLVSSWHPTIVQLAERGQFRYQFRADGETLNFHIPGGWPGDYTDRTEPQWIDLRRLAGDKSPLHQKFDVVILIDNSTTCGELLAAAGPHKNPRTSLLVTGEYAAFLRSKTEDVEHQPPKRSLAARVRSLFRR